MSIILYTILMVACLSLTFGMFLTRNSLLGFPSGIFWAISGAYCYQHYATVWDLWYLTFFASMGMLIFTIFAAYSLRKRDLAGPDADKGRFIDEGKGKGRVASDKLATGDSGSRREPSWGDIDHLDAFETEDSSASERAQGIRERAKERKKKVKWGEFK